jgi:hypothetical protein
MNARMKKTSPQSDEVLDDGNLDAYLADLAPRPIVWPAANPVD